MTIPCHAPKTANPVYLNLIAVKTIFFNSLQSLIQGSSLYALELYLAREKRKGEYERVIKGKHHVFRSIFPISLCLLRIVHSRVYSYLAMIYFFDELNTYAKPLAIAKALRTPASALINPLPYWLS